MQGETEAAIVAALRRIIRAVDLHSKYLAQQYGLTGPQLTVLQQIAREPGQTTSELAESVSLGQATISDMLERLEKRKLVARRRSPTDKRCVLNELTEAGRSAIESTPPLLQERFAHELSALEDWERTMLLSSLERVAKMMHADALEASPHLVTGPMGVSAEKTAEFLDETERED